MTSDRHCHRRASSEWHSPSTSQRWRTHISQQRMRIQRLKYVSDQAWTAFHSLLYPLQLRPLELFLPQIPWPKNRAPEGNEHSPEPVGYRPPIAPILRATSFGSNAMSASEDEDGPFARGGGGSRRPSRGGGEAAVVKPHMSTMDLIAMSISMGGAQIIWTMELG